MGLSRGKLKGKHSCVLPHFGISFKLENKSLAFWLQKQKRITIYRGYVKNIPKKTG